MPRFFVEEAARSSLPEPGEEYFISGENGRHISRSLRMGPGESLTLCDGMGNDRDCVIISCSPQGALVRVEARRRNESEPKTRVTVYQCLPKSDKLEQVIQKAVELGAVAVCPVESRNCVAKVSHKDREQKQRRWQKIALEAAQQSGRGAVPQVSAPLPLKTALEAAAQQGTVLFFYEKGEGSLKEAMRQAGGTISVFVGPEGGFAPEEAELARQCGALVLTLGRRILRTETAPVAALAAIFYEKGEMEL